MLKKKKVHVLEKAIEKAEAVVEAVEQEDTVSVEMTPEQRDKFVAFTAEQEEKAEAEPSEMPTQVMHLNYRHNIGSKIYGPGKADVRQEHVGLVTVGEQRRIRAELKLNTSAGTIKNLGSLG